MNIIGIMTGNSLDGCDIVLTKFDAEKMNDLVFGSFDISKQLQKDILSLKKKIQTKKILLTELTDNSFFVNVHNRYVRWIYLSIKRFLKENNLTVKDVDLIGFHGQTLDHNPKSVASSLEDVYTVQMGSGQMLADLTNIPVVSDFRSDDVMNGGEGAPLMPPHNEHYAKMLGLKDAVFYNAGNTSNLALIENGLVQMGFDAGPFNELSDYLVRQYKNESFDRNGAYGLKGVLDIDLLMVLFQEAVKTKTKENFLLLPPPKSSDPSLYGFKHQLKINSEDDFYRVLHTVQYFAGYVAAHALTHVTSKKLPDTFVLFGGGWKNPVSRMAFQNLLLGKDKPLQMHEDVFKNILEKFEKNPAFLMPNGAAYMEARLMADLAYSFEQKKCWTNKKLTGVLNQIILGVKSTPKKDRTNYTDMLSRANKGWQSLK
jgi:anhydro-N-acetylmuramic acid kinase